MDAKGLTALEVLLGIVIVAASLYVIAGMWKSMDALQSFAEDSSGLKRMEDGIRNGVTSRELFLAALSLRPEIKTCVENDGILCQAKTLKSVTLYSAKNTLATGMFYAADERCDGTNCPVRVAAELLPVCANGAQSCDRAERLEIRYSIAVAQLDPSLLRGIRSYTVLRKNTISVTTREPRAQDLVSLCEPTSDGRPAFASAIVKGRIDKRRCLSPPARSPQIIGVNPGQCPARSVLVGLAANGSIACETY